MCRNNQENGRINAMDKRQAIDLVRQYKGVIAESFGDAKIYLYGSYSKGNAHKDSDIDVAVIVNSPVQDWLQMSAYLWKMTRQVSTLIEPVLIEECHPSPLYEDILKTGTFIQ